MARELLLRLLVADDGGPCRCSRRDIPERPATATPQPALRRLHGVRYHRGGGITAERIASEVAARTGLHTSWSLKQHRTMLSHLLEQTVFNGQALGERMGIIRESLKLVFEEPDLQLPAVQ